MCYESKERRDEREYNETYTGGNKRSKINEMFDARIRDVDSSYNEEKDGC